MAVKTEKIQAVESFAGEIKGKSLIFFTYDGIDVANLTAVRNQLRPLGGKVKVLKNTLLKRALEKQNIKPEEKLFKGMLAVAITEGTQYSPSGKILADAEKSEKIVIRGGFYDGNVVEAVLVKKLANIPTRQTLYSMLVGSLASPVANLVYTLQGIAEQKQKAAG